MSEGTTVIVGGTRGCGRALAEHIAGEGGRVVISGRDRAAAEQVAEQIGGGTKAVALDLATPDTIGSALAEVGAVDHVVLAAIERDSNSVRDYDIARAVRLVTLKLVGYTEVVHALHERMHEHSSVLLFGGMAMRWPYPGSTTVTSVNGAVSSMVRTFLVELAPVRVNALHPGIVGDSPAWVGAQQVLDNVVARTPTGRCVTMHDVTDAALFLLRNAAVNGVNLELDGAWMMR